MADRQAQFHRSAMAGRPVLECVGSPEDLRSLFTREPLSRVSALERDSLGFDVVGSLRDYVSLDAIQVLRHKLLAAGVAKAPRGPKAALVDLCIDIFPPRALEDFMIRALPYGPDRAKEIRRLAELGKR